MNAILVVYVAYDSPKSEYITVTKADLSGICSIRELIAGLRGFAANEIKILDLLPQ